MLVGTFARHARWASFAATGVVLSAVYLLWSYQRVFLGQVTLDRNQALPDATRRERTILFVAAAVILWMGIGSTMFTRRMEASAQQVLEQMNRPHAYLAGPGLPARGGDMRQATVIIPGSGARGR